MPVCSISCFSHALGTSQDINLILPDPGIAVSRCSVLYLLHGLHDGPQSWLQRTRLVDYAEQYQLLIVMPYAQRSFYSDQHLGYRWRQWIENELPSFIGQWFSVGGAGEHIAGLSMGGFGAYKLAMSHLERFKSIGSFSGAFGAEHPQRGKLWQDIALDHHLNWGGLDRVEGSCEDSTLQTLKAFAVSSARPYIYLSCGSEDSLMPANQLLLSQLKQLNADVDFIERAGGHTWKLWDQDIEEYLRRLADRGLLKRMPE